MHAGFHLQENVTEVSSVPAGAAPLMTLTGIPSYWQCTRVIATESPGVSSVPSTITALPES